MFESERERRPGADDIACTGISPFTPVNRLWDEGEPSVFLRPSGSRRED